MLAVGTGGKVDIQERLAMLQALLNVPEYVVFPGEVSWQAIQNPVERARVRNRQRRRAERRLYPGRHAALMRKYYREHPSILYKRGKERNGTPEGRAVLAKKTAKRRKRSTDPELYAARVELLHTLREPCAVCGALYLITHQIDHIIALCLGGTDDWDNLQPLCIKCHRKKTGEDICKLISSRKTGRALGKPRPATSAVFNPSRGAPLAVIGVPGSFSFQGCVLPPE